MTNDPFEDADIISSYPDSQAVADGVLVDITGLGLTFRGHQVNRMTQALYASCTPFVVAFKDGEVVIDDEGVAIAMPVAAEEGDKEWNDAFASMLRTKLSLAIDTAGRDEVHLRGTMFRLPGGGDDGPIWLVLNELDGFTVMFSSDY